MEITFTDIKMHKKYLESSFPKRFYVQSASITSEGNLLALCIAKWGNSILLDYRQQYQNMV